MPDFHKIAALQTTAVTQSNKQITIKGVYLRGIEFPRAIAVKATVSYELRLWLNGYKNKTFYRLVSKPVPN